MLLEGESFECYINCSVGLICGELGLEGKIYSFLSLFFYWELGVRGEEDEGVGEDKREISKNWRVIVSA